VITKKIFIISISLLFFFNASLNAQGKKAAETKNDSIDTGDSIESLFKTEDGMKPLIAKSEPFTISYGGWFTTAVIDDRSGNSGSSTEIMSSVSTVKVWLKTTLPYNSYIYLRGMDRYTYYIKKPDGSDALYENENDIDLDAGYFSMSILNNRIDYSLGRKFFLLGSGILFNGRGDGGELNIYSKYIDLNFFGAYTGLLSKESNPYRLSSTLVTATEGTDEGKRIFAGGSLSRTIYNQTIYFLALYQQDKNDDINKATYPYAKGDYNSQYYGLGIKGVFKNASYFGEYIIERGKSYTEPVPSIANDKQDIKASAAIFSMNYYINAKLRPVLLLQYAYGSGDSDKDNPSSTTGNTNSDDKGFMYFGNYSGGFALRPYLSNIHIYRAGVAISPLIESNAAIWLKRMNIAVTYSNYQKDISNGTINSGEAPEPNKAIGHGFDLGLTWQIFSDMSFFGNVGLFMPGPAYASGEKNRTFVMAGLNLSF
jgi:hypothetical protein